MTCKLIGLMRILVVEDDPLLAAGLARVLGRCGHAVDRAASGIQADNLLRNTLYELVVLDIGLPDIDGFELARRLKADPLSRNLVIIALTAYSMKEDEEKAIAAGSAPAGPLEFRGLTIDIEVKRVKVHDVAVDLTVREWALLELFLARPGRVLSKEQIAQQLVNYDDALSLNTIEVYVSRLRSKIETEGVKIRTVRGFGYLWEAESV